MPTFYAEDVDIDVDEFLSSCSSDEIEEIIEALIEDGHISEQHREKYTLLSATESQFEEALNKLHNKWNMLTQEEEQAILKIASRF